MAGARNTSVSTSKRRLVLLISSLVLAAVFVGGVAGAQTTPPLPAEPTGETTTIDCPLPVPDDVPLICGQLTVPEDYAVPDGSQVELPYIVLSARSGAARPDPVVFTSGGPGYSALDSVWGFSRSPILDQRDVVIVEQRGNRYARPSFVCDISVWWSDEPRNTPCLDSLLADGVDMSQYTTVNMTRDLIALRQALGYEQWNLFGTSFSTSLMLLVMDSDPQGTRSAVLLSVKPPSETTFSHESDSPLRAIEELFAACADDDRCSAAYPDLEQRFMDLVRRLNQDPVAVTVDLRGSDEPIPLELDGDRFIDWIVINQLYGPVFPEHGASHLPFLIDKAAGGDTGVLVKATESHWSEGLDDPNWAWGLMFAVNCQQDLPAAGDSRPSADLAAAERLDGFARSDAQREVCAAWDLPPQPPAADHYIESDIPALVLAGSFDPVTPPVWSRTTADHLANSTYVEFGGQGHNVDADNPCANELVVAFLEDPEAELDTSCVLDAPTPSFVLPNEIYYAPGLASSGDEVSIGEPQGVAWIEALVLASLAGSLFAVVALAVWGLIRLIRRARIRRPGREPDERGQLPAVALSGLVALAILALPVLMTLIHDEFVGSTAFRFGLGPSRDILPATILAWLVPTTAVAAVVLLFLCVRAWISGLWNRTARVLTTVAAVAAVPMLLLAARWDLYTMLL